MRKRFIKLSEIQLQTAPESMRALTVQLFTRNATKLLYTVFTLERSRRLEESSARPYCMFILINGGTLERGTERQKRAICPRRPH